jgi:hypothetical protein
VAYKTSIPNWVPDLFTSITSHRLQSSETISSTAQVVHLDQFLQRLQLSAGSSLSSSGPTGPTLCKNRDFHGGDYEECRLLDVTPYGSCKNRSFGGT